MLGPVVLPRQVYTLVLNSLLVPLSVGTLQMSLAIPMAPVGCAVCNDWQLSLNLYVWACSLRTRLYTTFLGLVRLTMALVWPDAQASARTTHVKFFRRVVGSCAR